MNDSAKDIDYETGFTLEGRVLCSDDACIGTVGEDGKCKICGLVYEGDESPGETSGETATTDEEPRGSAPPSPAPSTSEDAHDPNERVCCPDDTCIGVIGEDGKCGTCGRSAGSSVDG